ncbi:hypothetical protein D3C87_125520 [compost metagenome]
MKNAIRFHSSISLIVLALAACAGPEVNPGPSSGTALLAQMAGPMTPDGSPALNHKNAETYLQRSPNAAISGKVFVKSDLPTSLARAPVSLFQLKNSNWSLVSSVNTESDGSFQFTQKLLPGLYELRVQTKAYEGVLPLNLNERTLDLIFEVSRK